ncbi:hypothetical protein C2G38_2238064 [Gigaspora rosea]|uniref:Uncharacterized protein n=1 Tax=Gigaspora rosea TaxID=44941 RepID=A0A397WAX9_9GLOM|nr:hypothetical protein C2G38_2238064 [Gigaspora rosea]
MPKKRASLFVRIKNLVDSILRIWKNPEYQTPRPNINESTWGHNVLKPIFDFIDYDLESELLIRWDAVTSQVTLGRNGAKGPIKKYDIIGVNKNENYDLELILEKYPEVTKEAENKVSKFMNPEEKSEFWSEFCPYFLEELLARNVVWFLNQNARLAYIEPNNYHSKYRLNTTFELNNTSLRLILFQISFLKIMQGIGEDIWLSIG